MLPSFPISHKTINVVSYYGTCRKFTLILMRDVLVNLMRKPQPTLYRLTLVKNVALNIVEKLESAPKCDCSSQQEHLQFMHLINTILKLFDDENVNLFIRLSVIYAVRTCTHNKNFL